MRGPLSAPRGHTEAPFPPRFLAHRTRRSRRDRRPTDRRQHPGPGVHRLRGCGLRRSENSSSRPRRRGDVIWRSRRWAASCCASRRRGPDPSTSSRLWNRYARARRARKPVACSHRTPRVRASAQSFFFAFFPRMCEPRVRNPAEPRPPSRAPPASPAAPSRPGPSIPAATLLAPAPAGAPTAGARPPAQ